MVCRYFMGTSREIGEFGLAHAQKQIVRLHHLIASSCPECCFVTNWQQI
jgi:hypothetical protein